MEYPNHFQFCLLPYMVNKKVYKNVHIHVTTSFNIVTTDKNTNHNGKSMPHDDKYTIPHLIMLLQ